jgi:hypothetical protein
MTEDATTARQTRITHSQCARLAGLLPMEYKPTELAEEIGCHRSTVYESYIPNGCPHRRDRNQQIWINGIEFAAWARATIQHRKLVMGADEAFCMRCKRVVTMRGPVRRSEAKAAWLLHATCPQCGCDVVRFESPDGSVG